VTLELDFCGVRVDLRGDAEAVGELGVHFARFVVGAASPHADACVELCRETPSELGAGRRLTADQVLERGLVYNDGSVTFVDHHGSALSRYDFERELGRVTASAVSDLVELGYLMIHSRVGQLLEERGLVRIHCLGVELGGRAALVLTPSGGGKSRLALAALQSTRLRLLGDDMVVLDASGRAHPFHTPLGVSDPALAEGLGTARRFRRRHHQPKWIVPIDRHELLCSEPVRVDSVVLAERVTSPPTLLVPISRRVAARAVVRDLVVGLGLPQVLELVARRGTRDLWKQAPSAARRLRIAARLLTSARCFRLEVASPGEGAGKLAELLERN
jgi:hypothetical protein